MKNSRSDGLSVIDVLGLIFIVLKLCGVINWSWLWVLSPVWIKIILFTIIYFKYK